MLAGRIPVRQTILEETRRFLTSQSLTPEMQQIFLSAFEKLHQEALPSSHNIFLPCLDLPVLVAQALGTSGGQNLTATGVATTLLYLGIDVLDDLADGDAARHWPGLSPDQMHLAGTTLVAALAPLAIETMAASCEVKHQMVTSMARGLLQMSLGQSQDLSLTARENISLEEIEESVCGKSGEEAALFATLGALCAGASMEIGRQYASLGQWIGMALQIASDCHDLFQSPISRDLIAGKQTLPILFALSRMNPEERHRWHQCLQAAREDPSLRPGILRELDRRGARRFCALLVENYCQKALSVLDLLPLQEAAVSSFLEVIHPISFGRFL